MKWIGISFIPIPRDLRVMKIFGENESVDL
jgi:hypothetical protein